MLHARPIDVCTCKSTTQSGAGKLAINPTHAKCATHAKTCLIAHVHYNTPVNIEY